MSGDTKKGRATEPAKEKGPRDAEWTRGLKKLYDSVVEEPMPDSFRDLLSKLDTGE